MAFTTVASAAVATTLLTADASRSAVIITNTDANVVYLLFSGTGTVSSTNYSVSLAANATYTVPSAFAGEKITGIWAVDGTGSALITYR